MHLLFWFQKEDGDSGFCMVVWYWSKRRKKHFEAEAYIYIYSFYYMHIVLVHYCISYTLVTANRAACLYLQFCVHYEDR